MLGVGLREHHQFDVVRIAAQVDVTHAQVVDLILRQRQPQTGVGALQFSQRDHVQSAACRCGEQRSGLIGIGQQRLGHRIVQRFGDRRADGGILRPTDQIDPGAAFDALHRLAGAAQQFAGFTGPRRDSAQSGRDKPRDRAIGPQGVIAVGFKNALQSARIRGAPRFGLDPVREPRPGDA